jgi:hypothetical protein
MTIESILSQLMTLVGTYSPFVGLSLFVLCLIGEVIGLGIPYVLETALMLAGYQVSANVYAFFDVIIILLMTQAGRLTGTFIVYSFARTGSRLALKITSFFRPKNGNGNSIFARMVKGINLLSPFSVAAGRLLWLRYPLTLMLASQKKLRVLMLGTMLSSAIYDVTFLVIGAVVGANTRLKPFEVILLFMAGLTVVYIVFFTVQKLRQRHAAADTAGEAE